MFEVDRFTRQKLAHSVDVGLTCSLQQRVTFELVCTTQQNCSNEQSIFEAFSDRLVTVDLLGNSGGGRDVERGLGVAVGEVGICTVGEQQ